MSHKTPMIYLVLYGFIYLDIDFKNFIIPPHHFGNRNIIIKKYNSFNKYYTTNFIKIHTNEKKK